jgi:hypothetical protein
LDAGREGYFSLLPPAEVAGGKQRGDLRGLSRARFVVAGRGSVLEPGEQVCPPGLGEAGVVAVDGCQVGVNAVPGA